jgi:hypothetical protein
MHQADKVPGLFGAAKSRVPGPDRARPKAFALALLPMALCLLQLAGCSTTAPTAATAPPATAAFGIPAPEAQVDSTGPVVHGIRVQALHLSAAGSMLDFRYRVVDPVAAAPLLNGKLKVYLLDEARGAKLGVPASPVLGNVRQTARNNRISTDHTYFIMFGNPGKAVRSGDKVTLLVGDARFVDVQVH